MTLACSPDTGVTMNSAPDSETKRNPSDSAGGSLLCAIWERPEDHRPFWRRFWCSAPDGKGRCFRAVTVPAVPRYTRLIL